MNALHGERWIWLFVGGLILVGLGIALGGQSFSGAFPLLLLVLVCPLTMLLIMGSMGHNMQGDHHMMHDPAASPPPTDVGSTPDEQLSILRAQLADTQAQQERLAQQIEALQRKTMRADHTARPTGSA